MNLIDNIVSIFIVFWAVVDPVGTVPVFIAITKKYNDKEKVRIAKFATLVACGVLFFFLLVGERLLRNIGVPLAAFQTSGGVILFLFAINMIFGSSKPEEEIDLIKSSDETAIFPLAVPSIAGPGAILAVVLISDTNASNMKMQLVIGGVLLGVLLINYVFMRLANKIHQRIGDSGAIVISKVMGLILASMAANHILMGIKAFFKIV